MPLPTTSNTTSPRSQGLHCRIGSTYYRLVSLQDAVPTIKTAPLQPPRIDTAANPEDIRPEFGTLYSLSDFTGGEGLDFAHRINPTPRDATRFWDSEGINISRVEPGQSSSITLSHDVEEAIATNTIAWTGAPFQYFANSLFIVDSANNRINRYNDEFADPLVLSLAENPSAGGMTGVGSIHVHGEYLYAMVTGDGINRRDSGGTWTNFSDKSGVNQLWSAKGRLIGDAGTNDNELWEINAGIAANSNLLHTLDIGARFIDVTECGSYIVAAASDGYIYIFGLNEETSTVTLAARHYITTGRVHGVAQFPGTSVLYIAYNDRLNTTVIQAELDANGVLQNGRVIVEEPADPTGSLTNSNITLPMVAHGDAMFILMPDGWLWMHDLVTDGRHKHLLMESTEDSWRWPALVNVRGRWFAWRNAGAGVGSTGLAREDTLYESTGYVISPLVDHFSAADKTWAGLTVDLPDVPTGTSVVVYYSTDPDAILNPAHASWTQIKSITSGTDTTETTIGVKSRYLAIKVVLNANPTRNVAPTFRSFTTRAFPGPGDIILTLPINTSDQIEMPGRQRVTVPNLGTAVYESLRNIEGTSVTCELLDPAETIVGVVEEVASRLLVPNARGSETFTTVVRIRGRRTS